MVVTALIDNGSCGTFLHHDTAIKANYQVTNCKPVKVRVVNGNILWSKAQCLQSPYFIQGTEFLADFRILPLTRYDIILGADWLAQYSPILMDYNVRYIAVTLSDGKMVQFTEDTLHKKPGIIPVEKLCTLMQKVACAAVIYAYDTMEVAAPITPTPLALQPILDQFQDIFETPVDLPPVRTTDHAINLLPDHKVVNQRSYRLPHHQKEAMETIVAQLLQSTVIRPSLSPFSSPAILVKKKDGT